MLGAPRPNRSLRLSAALCVDANQSACLPLMSRGSLADLGKQSRGPLVQFFWQARITGHSLKAARSNLRLSRSLEAANVSRSVRYFSGSLTADRLRASAQFCPSNPPAASSIVLVLVLDYSHVLQVVDFAVVFRGAVQLILLGSTTDWLGFDN